MAGDKIIKSDNATSGNFFDGGNGRNLGLENDKYDLEKELFEHQIAINERGNNLTAEEAAKLRKEGLEALAKNHEAAIKGINTQSLINVGTNIMGMVFSAGSAASAIAAKNIALKGAQGAVKAMTQSGKLVQNGSNYVLKGTSLAFKETAENGLKVSVLSTMKTMAKEATVGSFKGAKGALGFLGAVGKSAKTLAIGSTNVLGAIGAKCMTGGAAGKGLISKLVTGMAKGAVGIGAVTAPLITTQVITKNISDKKTAELNDAISVLSDGNLYYNDCYDSLTADQKEQYERLQNERDVACAELLEDYAGYMDEEGNFSDQAKAQEFYDKYKIIEEAAAADLAEQTAAWSGYADYVTHEGIANRLAESTIDNEVDVDQFRKTSTYGDWVFSDERSADALKNAEEAQALREDLNDDGFLGFIDKIHDTLIHYAPVLSYVEAGLKIGADRLMEGVSGLFKFNYDEKYQGVGIGDLAASISADAEADQEKRERINDLEKGSHDLALTDVTEYKERAANNTLIPGSNEPKAADDNQADFEAEPDPA